MAENTVELYDGYEVTIKGGDEIITNDLQLLKAMQIDLFEGQQLAVGLSNCYYHQETLEKLLDIIAVNKSENMEFDKVKPGKIKEALMLFFAGAGLYFQG